MRKVLGLAIVFAFALTIPAAAQDAKGTVRWVDTSDHTIVLDDGTRLWVSESQIRFLAIGDEVQASYETKGNQKVVTGMARRMKTLDESTDPLKSLQSGDN